MYTCTHMHARLKLATEWLHTLVACLLAPRGTAHHRVAATPMKLLLQMSVCMSLLFATKVGAHNSYTRVEHA